jgi:hypothetical protein
MQMHASGASHVKLTDPTVAMQLSWQRREACSLGHQTVVPMGLARCIVAQVGCEHARVQSPKKQGQQIKGAFIIEPTGIMLEGKLRENLFVRIPALHKEVCKAAS